MANSDPVPVRSHLLATLLAGEDGGGVRLAARGAVRGRALHRAVPALGAPGLLLPGGDGAPGFGHLVGTAVDAGVAVQCLSGAEHLGKKGSDMTSTVLKRKLGLLVTRW